MQAANKAVVQVSRGTSVILLLVYILYLLFQLKSHAYIYESTPQHKIDEESHPGVLAEILNSSSSSESSSSDDNDSDSSSGSQTTAKRIRKAIRKRRHRKSSAGSKDSQISPSAQESDRVSFPSRQTVPLSLLKHSSLSSKKSLSPKAFCGEDEANQEETGGRFGRHPGVTTHDFESGPSPEASHETGKRQREKNLRISRRDRKECGLRAPAELQSQHSELSGRRVEFTSPSNAEQSPKRPFTLRGISRERLSIPRFIPTLQFGSNNIGETQQRPSISRNGNQPILRRTTSLPDRLYNSSHYTPTIPSVQPLPHLMPIILPQESDTDSETDKKQHISRTASIILLLVSTGLVAVCAEFLVESIDYLVKNTGISQAFIGLIILPIVGNAAEHVTAVSMASKNKMDLAIGVALGSSIQIAIFVTPIIVLLGWCLHTDMSLYFSLFETVSLFASAFIANYLMLDGRTNYLEGALLISAYVIIAVAAFFYPSCSNLSDADPKLC
ncbi:conserved hypothetical protein [Uncinocarpus reesii 1704]|uniref:Sodium/calcium exchanger membrane region domain-containing protein n=1 Tax=Uncinocarpus reesii (strain UAMH 1704) TaxID=336963 RepID=C4JZH2_UNCRE|nr:uncharacterized protein UREG_07573 [Uncinocarpus reesii 1704]EEP82708.1 conserved hypothetical protein [Uncinocarpus reesii 1704]